MSDFASDGANGKRPVFAAAEIVVVEHDDALRDAMAGRLADDGHHVRTARDTDSARTLLASFPAKIVIIGETDKGLLAELCSDAPWASVAVLNSPTPEARIAALTMGCDDCVAPPVHLGELAARVQAILRRTRRGRRLYLGAAVVDLDARTLTVEGSDVPLTRGEFQVVAALAEADGAVVDRETLVKGLKRRSSEGDLRSTDALIARIRRKAGPALPIISVPGVGYRLNSGHRKYSKESGNSGRSQAVHGRGEARGLFPCPQSPRPGGDPHSD